MAGELKTFFAAHLVCNVQSKQENMIMFQIKLKFHSMIHMMRDILTDRENPNFSWYGIVLFNRQKDIPLIMYDEVVAEVEA